VAPVKKGLYSISLTTRPLYLTATSQFTRLVCRNNHNISTAEGENVSLVLLYLAVVLCPFTQLYAWCNPVYTDSMEQRPS
jgi:hypothetical protein